MALRGLLVRHRMLGRDIYSRTIYRARVSLTAGIGVALLSITFELAITLLGDRPRKARTRGAVPA